MEEEQQLIDVPLLPREVLSTLVGTKVKDVNLRPKTRAIVEDIKIKFQRNLKYVNQRRNKKLKCRKF